MSKEIRNTIDTITHLDSMKAVKVALGLSEANQNSTSKVMEVVSLLDGNLKELANKFSELQKRLELVEDGLERVVKKQVEDYERSQNRSA